MKITGRVWKFGHDINTDLIFPHDSIRLKPAEQAKLIFRDNRPGWSELVQKGDIIVSGKNFGTGSARPGAVLLKTLGLGGMLSDSINGVFFRNCVSYGFPALQYEGVSDLFEEGDVAEFELTTGLIRNLTTGKELQGTPLPGSMVETVEAGGVIDVLISKGLVEPLE
ncbi:MAG: 3-isopropylmalate dehydratase small subunit [Clostridiales Family XIII bacterium]|jgi:3-isopropylmalate/(R)-2-methylmalate dehydratase small subunit|nr:3-isopropylmalate dehydratase small subunit [Clostridiales Family XIII bacterium]